MIYINIAAAAVGYLAVGNARHAYPLNSTQGRNAMVNGKVSVVVTAGIAGGMAEVLWIAAATTVLGADGRAVASAVGATVVPAMAASGYAPWLGLAIHFLLSIALAAVFVRTFSRRCSPATLVAAAIAALAAVWAVNFLLLLPVLNPAFVSLLPLPVTLISKLLFGLAMAVVLLAGRKGTVFSPAAPRRAPA